MFQWISLKPGAVRKTHYLPNPTGIVALEHIAFILAVIFYYISLVSASINDTHHYEELRYMADIKFKCLETETPASYVKRLSRLMHSAYANEHILSGPLRFWEYNPSGILDVVARLSPEKTKVFLCSKTFKDEGSLVWSKEKWYGTEFTRKSLTLEDIPVS